MWVDFLLECIRYGKIRRQSSTEGTVSSVLTPRAFSRGVSGEEDEEDVAGVLELISDMLRNQSFKQKKSWKHVRGKAKKDIK